MKSMHHTEKTILVLGGNGKTGRHVVHRLQRLEIPVRIGSRSAAIPFDWEKPETWDAVVQKIQAVYITFQPDLAVPGSAETIHRFSEMAVHKGVQKLVLLSGRGEPEARACEEIIKNAGVDWSIVRASWFNQNFSESFMLEPILTGNVAMPAGNVGEPFIDAEDVADIATAALTSDKHSGKLYEVTGPRLLSFSDVVTEIAKATGRPIRYTEISAEEYRSQLQEYQVPQEYISLLTYLFSEVLDGRNACITDGVEQALGRKPIDFSDYVKRTVRTGVWNATTLT